VPPSNDLEGLLVGGYELEIEQIRRAAGAAQSAGDQLAGLDVGCRIGAGAGFLPGAQSGKQLQLLEDSWLRRAREFSDSLIDHGTKLTWAAGDYITDDAKAAAAFQPVHVGGHREFL
jgi:hypothetical protein